MIGRHTFQFHKTEGHDCNPKITFDYNSDRNQGIRNRETNNAQDLSSSNLKRCYVLTNL